MIKKDSLWFITLFSLILVLSVYYITMPQNNRFAMDDIDCNTIECIIENSTSQEMIESNDTTVIEVLKIQHTNEINDRLNELRSVIADENTTVAEKNNAYNVIKEIERVNNEELRLVGIIEEEFGYQAIVKILTNEIEVVVGSDIHSVELANEIMNVIKAEFGGNVYVSVDFKY